MKKKEAIEMLKSKMDGSVDTSYEWAETVRMAIEALQKDIERHKMVIRASERHLNIVRCKNCKHRSYEGWCDVYIQPRMDTDFCNHGERLCNHDCAKG